MLISQNFHNHPDCTASISQKKNNPNENMKRAAAKQRIERYYYQLLEGCGRENCTNENCASCANFIFKDIQNNEAAVKAIDLFKAQALLCDSQPVKVAKNADNSVDGTAASCSTGSDNTASLDVSEQPSQSVSNLSCEESSMSSTSLVTADTHQQESMDYISTLESISTDSMDVAPGSLQPSVGSSGQSLSLAHALSLAQLIPVSKTDPVSKTTEKSKEDLPYLTEQKLHSIILQCTEDNNWSLLKSTLYSVFENTQSLLQSFRRELSPPASKEDLRSMEVDLDKDTDDKLSSCGSVEDLSTTVKDHEHSLDLESLRRSYKELFAIPDIPFQDALVNALVYLSKSIELEMKYQSPYEKDPNYLNIFMIVLEIPLLFNPEFIESATPLFLKSVGNLPTKAQAKLAKLWSQFPKEWLKDLLHGLQQLITVKCITTEWSRRYVVNDSIDITGAVKVMKILYYACILGGRLDSPELIEAEKSFTAEAEAKLNELYQGAIGREQKERIPPKADPLAKELDIDELNCRAPILEWDDFINEPLCDVIEMDKDYTYYKAESPDKFTFMSHSFILTTAVKNLGLYYDNRIRMIEERRSSILQSFLNGGLHMPYLKLRIRRDHVIDDALVNLEMAAMDNPQDLKKQLYVEFDGEQGIDEGGVSKEFFQLVVEEIFNPDIGMFTQNDETGNGWFNPTSFENDGQFTLIGIVLGLAIYNNIILDIHFPMVVYRKLFGKKGTFEDLKYSHPTLARSLTEMLEYDGDVEETFVQAFQISYQDVFGTVLTQDLKPDGSTCMVNQENRKEFVDLYADFLLNKSIEKQFKAFYRGFLMVTDESPLKVLFRPEEIELLVCGSKHFDFHALEDTTEYDGGFTVNSETIRHFWETVHDFSDDQKSKLLQFTTGSDRSPVGGLSKLKLIIARNGPDSERLPTAHTCFNVLLLPDYSTKEKLQERLIKAISYAKGFGML